MKLIPLSINLDCYTIKMSGKSIIELLKIHRIRKTLMAPTTASDWITIANERAADADTMKITRCTSIGCVYMAGYAIECSLKALLQSRGIAFPRHGQEGHNLRGLWEKSRFRLSDLSDPTGAKTFFIESWDTSLRYELTCDSSLTISELVDGAKNLTGWIQSQIRRTNRSRR